MISLKDGDEVVGAVELRTGDEALCFITTDAQLLHFGADGVRPQGRSGGGMAGIRLAAGARVVYFGAVDPADVRRGHRRGVVDGAARHRAGAVKVTPFAEYPAKGRATGGVRCHRFLKGEDELVLAWAGAGPGPGRGGQRSARGPARADRPARRLRHARAASRSPRVAGPVMTLLLLPRGGETPT